MAEGAEERVLCPVCTQILPASRINAHLDSCLQPPASANGSCAPQPGSPAQEPGEQQSSKKRRLTGAFPLFQKVRPGGGDAAAAAACPSPSPHSPPPAKAPQLQQQEQAKSIPERLEGKPLADQMRPSTLENYMGQSKVLGASTMLRTLLESHDVPSIILWGPPGCGKTTLAHIIAKNSKKHNTRFVTVSATSASTNDIREVIKQAQNELKLFKRKTILFVDEIHRFNKLQQDTFLPHVECGTITLIGATTENPSFQVNTALLSRCRVIVLEKLSVEAMQAILIRAVKSLGIRVLDQDGHADSEDGNSSDSAEIPVYIEEKALSTLSHLCDGDARTGLNGLQLAVQARVAAGKQSYTHAGMKKPKSGIIIMEDHVKEGLQRSHILYDRAGLADPLALNQAVAAFQGCHLIGMPECEVLLAQCVIYLARAPKSIEVYSAYQNVKNCLKNHKGPLPSVPLHLRNAPTKLMKGLGYGKGYKYNPMYKEPVEQDYLPEELKGMNFFKKVH